MCCSHFLANFVMSANSDSLVIYILIMHKISFLQECLTLKCYTQRFKISLIHESFCSADSWHHWVLPNGQDKVNFWCSLSQVHSSMHSTGCINKQCLCIVDTVGFLCYNTLPKQVPGKINRNTLSFS